MSIRHTLMHPGGGKHKEFTQTSLSQARRWGRFVWVQREQTAGQMASSLPESRDVPALRTYGNPVAAHGDRRFVLTVNEEHRPQVLKCLPMGVYTSMVNTRAPQARTRTHRHAHTHKTRTQTDTHTDMHTRTHTHRSY